MGGVCGLPRSRGLWRMWRPNLQSLYWGLREPVSPTNAKPVSSSTKVGGRPLDSQRHLTLTATQPWKALGMSRTTWYRRKREGVRC